MVYGPAAEIKLWICGWICSPPIYSS